MRLLLKREEKLYNAYWVKRHSSGVVGWFGGRAVLAAMFGNSAPQDAHFCYPSDGNLHFSYKFFNGSGKLLRVETVYFDHVRVKDLTVQPKPQIDKLVRRAEVLHEHLVVEYRAIPLATYSSSPCVFQFPLASIPVGSAPSWGSAYKTVAESREDDVVVDASELVTGAINISALLSGRIQPHERAEREILRFALDQRACPVITLQALYVPEPTAA